MNESPRIADDPFPSTRWSRVLAAGDPRNPERGRDFDALARAYGRPIQAWLAHFCRVPFDGAADLAQDFFVHALETGTVAKADPARGSFRAFLKTALRNFAIDRKRRAMARKRGEGREVEELEGVELAAAGAEPDRALDDAWRELLLERALAELERELRAGGKETYWLVFSQYYLEAQPDLDYASVAARHAITTTAVGNYLMHSKRRFRALLCEFVTETVGDERALEEELAWLFAGVRT